MAGKTTPKKISEKKTTTQTHQCECGKHCSCGKKCCHGFWKKLIVVAVFFALGFATARMIPHQKPVKKPTSMFDKNGCLVVKTKSMEQKIPMMDLNKNGCVEKTEYSEYRRKMRKQAPKPTVQKQ